MSKLFFICLILMAGRCFAQGNNGDSLEKDIDSYTKKDSVRVLKILDYSRDLSKTDPQKSIRVATEGLQLANELKWSSGKVSLLLFIARVQTLEEKYDAAITAELEALKIAEDANDYDVKAYAHSQLSESYRLMSNDSLALFHAQKYFDIGTSVNNKYYISDAMTLLAGLYAQSDKWEKAETLLDKAMLLAVEMKDGYMQNRILLFKAERLANLTDYRGSIILYKKSLQYEQKNNDSYNGIAWLYATLSRLYSDMRNKDSAYFYARSGLQLSRKYNLTKELKDSYEALFYCHQKFGDYQKALEYRIIYDSIYNATYSVMSGQNAERARMELEQERKDALTKAATIKKEAESKRVRNLQYMTIGLILLVVLFLLWNNRQKQRAKKKIEKAYSELKSAQQQLIQSEKMASLGELTAGIAHEIQNPLNFVNNFSEVSNELIAEMNDELTKGDIEEAKAIASDIRQNLEKINQHGKRADAIVKGMLQHSQSSTGIKELTDINKLADEYVKLSYHGFRAKDKSFNAAVKTDYDESIGSIHIIPQDIGRVILNLINNAFYAVNEKKQISNEEYEPTVFVRTRKKNGKPGSFRVEITVADNGNGIPKKIFGKIFQPFFTTKPTGQGTGLGLSLSYDIVKAHDGELKVETEEGKGTSFKLTLPPD